MADHNHRNAQPDARRAAPRHNGALPAVGAYLTIATRTTMDTIERLYAPITERASQNPAIGTPVYKDNASARHPATAGSSFSWATHLLPAQRRQALCALYAFCREVDDIADCEASHAL